MLGFVTILLIGQLCGSHAFLSYGGLSSIHSALPHGYTLAVAPDSYGVHQDYEDDTNILGYGGISGFGNSYQQASPYDLYSTGSGYQDLYQHDPYMQDFERSYTLPRSSYHQQTSYVPVIIHKKQQKKKKIITVQHGFYIPGGTQMFGKFKDLHSCQKACEITPTCFAGDFDPWLGRCYAHSNMTACQAMSTHPAIIHFKKVPCALIETTRGLITLGTQIYNGLEQTGTVDLKSCLKKCATAGGGIAPTTATITTTPQLCFGIDYDFATHKCYFHTDSDLCPNDATILTPTRLVARASSVNILLCPREA